MMTDNRRWVLAVMALMLATTAAWARAVARVDGPAPARWREMQQPAPIVAGVRVLRDVAYGSDPRQRFDVYAPVPPAGAPAQPAPVILLVHGGGWRFGDKAMRNVVENKMARWVPRGFVLISVNYRMRPDTAPLQQAQDVARALAVAQRQASGWGGDARRFILMGHSAGAHLVALLNAEPALARAQGAAPWLGTVLLDSGSLDVVQTMRAPHFRLFDEAFGNAPADWLAASPLQQMQARMPPVLAVCSSLRLASCAQAQAFVAKARSFGGRASVLAEDLSHEAINRQLGLPSDYTMQVERFPGSLDPQVAQRLAGPALPVPALSLPVVMR